MQTGIIALIGLATMFVGWIMALILPTLGPAAWGILAVGAMLLLLAFVIDYRRVGSAIVSRRGRFSAGTTLMISVFAGIILFVNAISIGNNARLDTTGQSQFTVTSQTKDMLANLDEDIQIIKFFVPNDATSGAAFASNLLGEYQNFTDRLDISTVDPDEHPDQARDHGITDYQRAFFSTYGIPAQTVVFVGSAGERFVGLEQIMVAAEHAFTSAILAVTGTVQAKVFFISGHGEADIYDTSPSGYSFVREGLKDNLFQTAQVDLLQTDAVPEDAAALVLAAPDPDFPLTEREIELIQIYLAGGGRLILLANPDRSDEINRIVIPWGVVVAKETLIDPSSYAAPNTDSPSADRTSNSLGLATTYFPGATAVLPLGQGQKYAQAQPLVWTSGDAYLDADFDPAVESQFNEETDTKGIQIIGIRVGTVPPQPEDPNEPVTIPADYVDTRLVVFGDSDFATNKHFFNGSNGDLILNSISYLAAGTELISIDRKMLQPRRLVVSPGVLRFINYSSVGLLPLLVFVIGGIVWWRRR
jgi:hypothetical protein